jgi:hypothetical protein
MKCGIKRPDIREQSHQKARNGLFAKEEESIYRSSVKMSNGMYVQKRGKLPLLKQDALI